jgi:hypothetical protein
MLSKTRQPMNSQETKAVDALLAEHADGSTSSITRTEPGERGPLRVEIGNRSWLVNRKGTATQEKK